MAARVTVDQLLARHKKFALNPPSMPSVADMIAKNLDPAHIVVVSCADPRATPEDYFQLKAGEVIVLRNVGGRTVPALENILVLDSFVKVSDIIVVHHTDCGATHVTEAQVRSELKKRLPDDDKIETMQFGEIRDLKQSLKDDVAFLKSSPYIRDEIKPRVRGFLYNIKSGWMEEIEV